MFLAINYLSIIYTCIFLTVFVIAYLVVVASRLETLFKQGSTWQIRVAQILIALIVAYLVAEAVMGLVNATQF